MINGYVKSGKACEALSLYGKMEEEEICSNLLALHRVATLRHDELSRNWVGPQILVPQFLKDIVVVAVMLNKISIGLRNINISYSRISLADVAKKLRLDSPNPVADAESIVSKEIRDGAIDATLDHANGWMVSKETGDVYSTNEPQLAFNSRIAFCLNMHNEAVRVLHSPPNSHKEFYVHIHS
ncbi:probable 26S proteasome non-ATPase regulatory subunit 3 [Tanacetum coccineum]